MGLAQVASGLEAQLRKHKAYLGNHTSQGLARAPVGTAGEQLKGGKGSEAPWKAASWEELVRYGV